MSELNVVWFSRYGPEGASSRYRVHRIVDELRRGGAAHTVHPLATWQEPIRRQLTGNARRIGEIVGLDDAVSAVVVQKEPANPPALWPTVRPFVQRIAAPVVWDVDDAVWIGRTGADRMAKSMARRADVVVAGNDSIARWADQAGARRVAVIPTCFSPSRDCPVDRPGDGRTRFVWIGSPATAPLLIPMVNLLRRLLAEPTSELTFIGGAPPSALAEHPRVRTLDWSPETEHVELSRADYGLALQPRTEHADHKCGFKIVQYMAYGLVPIATDNPVHRSIMRGLGYLVGSSLGDAALPTQRPAERQVDAVRERWRSRYSLGAAVDAWDELLREVAT